MNLASHQRAARILFWFAQVIGVTLAAAISIFIGSSLISELIQDLVHIKEDYAVFLFFLCELLLLGSFIISWNRKRQGAILVTIFAALILIFWGGEDRNVVWLHLPLLLTGLLLLFYSYYKEWILKKKP